MRISQGYSANILRDVVMILNDWYYNVYDERFFVWPLGVLFRVQSINSILVESLCCTKAVDREPTRSCFNAAVM
jgi:hypothetical protein